MTEREYEMQSVVPVTFTSPTASESRIAVQPEMQPEMKLVYVTPDIALTYLSNSDLNRKLSKPRSVQLAQAFQRGEHRLTGDAITFSKKGKMTNGQHRMLAVSIADLPYGLPFWIMVNSEDDANMVTDTGRSRSFTDQLRLRSIPNASNTAAATKLLSQYQDGTVADLKRWAGRLSPTVFQQWNFYTGDGTPENPGHAAEISAALKRADQVRRVLPIGASVLSVAWIVFSGIDPAEAEGFWDELRIRKEQSAAVASLVHFLNRQRKSRQRQSGWHTPLDARLQLALLFKAWNYWRDGTSPKTGLSFRSGGTSPEVFPVPR
jgi:hypothetical protein